MKKSAVKTHRYISIVFTLLIFSFHTHANSESSCQNPKDISAKWSGGEHIYLADKGFQRACAEIFNNNKYCQTAKIPRRDRKQTYSYGQISALSDFYMKPHQVWKERGNTQMSADESKRIFKCMNEQGKVFEEQKSHPEVNFPDCTWTYIVNTRTHLKVVSNNTAHFAWHNMKSYVKIHERALQLALKAHNLKLAGKEEDSDKALRRSLYMGAFADHFLTDSFAAGHVRVPRQQIKDWARKTLPGLFTSIRGEALSMILHDNEGKDQFEHEQGLEVSNSNGDLWTTHSDGKLHECTQDDDPGINFPTQAVALSVKEIFQAYHHGIVPPGVFSATQLVPFPSEHSIIEKYLLRSSAEGRDNLAERLHAKLPTALKLLTSKKDVLRMIDSLPSLMSKFRNNVQRQLRKSSALQLRLPAEYTRALSKVE